MSDRGASGREIPSRWQRNFALLAVLSLGLAIIISILSLLPQRPRAILFRSGRINLGGFSPDGKILAAEEWCESRDFENPIVWDVESGQELSFLDTKTCIGPIQFSQDESLLAVRQQAGESYRIAVFDLTTRREMVSISPSYFPGYRPGFCFVPDRHTLAITTVQKQRTCLKFWNLKTPQDTFSLPEIGCPIAFSPDGKIMVTREGTEISPDIEEQVALREVKSGEKLATFNVSEGRISKVEFSPDGNFLAADSRKEIGIYDLLRGERLYIPTVYVWDVRGKRLMTTECGYKDPVFLTGGQELATFGYDTFGCQVNRVHTWDLSADNRLRIKENRECDGEAIPVPGTNLVAVYKTRHIEPTLVRQWLGNYFSQLKEPAWVTDLKLLDLGTGREQAHLVLPQGVSQLQVSRDVKTLAVKISDRDKDTIELWDISPRRPLRWIVGVLAVPTLFTVVLLRKWLEKRRNNGGGPLLAN
jgi:WD40 repeat protein